MRKIASVALVTCVFSLLLMATPAVTAKPSEPRALHCMIFIQVLPPDDHWEGRISGDIQGMFQLWEKENNFVVGKVEHYFERWVIYTDGGDVISGNDKGVWSFQTFKFRYNGDVTEASGDWAFLIGYRMHGVGYTTDLTYFPLHGVASLDMVPG